MQNRCPAGPAAHEHDTSSVHSAMPGLTVESSALQAKATRTKKPRVHATRDIARGYEDVDSSVNGPRLTAPGWLGAVVRCYLGATR